MREFVEFGVVGSHGGGMEGSVTGEGSGASLIQELRDDLGIIAPGIDGGFDISCVRVGGLPWDDKAVGRDAE